MGNNEIMARPTQEILAALRRGDAAGLVAAAGQDPQRLAQLAIELRRENVAVIGQHEVFTRRDEGGELQQVIAPVRLSLSDDTLYQIPVFGKYQPGTDEPLLDDDARGEWKAVVPRSAKHKATITAYGLTVLNKVAGCAVGLPDEVMVDGQRRTNPWVERVGGDVVRVVVRVHVVGPSPTTGNLVVVQYVLDYDPGKDLAHALLEKAKKASAAIMIYDVEAWPAHAATIPPGQRWKLIPLFGGIGLAINLANDEVAKVLKKHVGLLQGALKKAITVARRNAMRAHPALAYQTVMIGDAGFAVVPVTGWVLRGREHSTSRYLDLLERAARGALPGVEALEIEHQYDPEEGAGEDRGDEVVVDADDVVPSDERAELLQALEIQLLLLTPAQASRVYWSADATLDELRAVLEQAHALAGAK